MARAGSPPPTPRVTFTGFSVQTLQSEPLDSIDPEVRFTLSKKSYPPEGIDPFSPLRLPEFVEVVLKDISPEHLAESSLDLRLSLSRGVHEFPLAGNQQFQVLVDEDAMAYMHVDFGPPPEATGNASKVVRAVYSALHSGRPEPIVIRRFELTFSPELKLPNLASTLLEIQDLMEDKSLSGVLRSSLRPSATRLRERLKLTPFQQVLQSLAKSTGKLGHVALRHVHAEPVLRARTGKWELRIAFTGHVHLTGGIPPVPFTDVVVPAAILPIPFATVKDLLSPTPLSTASLHADRVRVDEAVEAAVGLLERSQGRLTAQVKLPRFVSQTRLTDHTRVTTRVDVPSDAELSVRFSAQKHDSRLSVDAEDVSVTWGDKGVHLEAKGLIEEAPNVSVPWIERLDTHLEMRIKPGSSIPTANVQIETRHPQATGVANMSVSLRDIVLDSGAGGVSVSRHAMELWPMNEPVSVQFKFKGDQRLQVPSAGMSSSARFDSGRGKATIELGPDGLWHVDVDGEFGVAAQVQKTVPEVPELSVSGGTLLGEIDGHVSVHAGVDAEVGETNAFDISFREGLLGAILRRTKVSLDDREVTLPEGTEMNIEVEEASLDASGMNDVVLGLGWNTHGGECLLRANNRSVSLFVSDLLAGHLRVRISSEGHVSFHGEREGLYGTRYFNTLLNPASDPEKLLELLSSEDALSHVFSALELLSPELAERVMTFRELALGLRKIAQRLEITQPADLIPREKMARFLSIALAGDESMLGRLSEQIRAATEGHGLDVVEVKNILRTYLDDFDIDYEISGIVKWLDGLVRPLPEQRPIAVSKEPSVSQQEQFQEILTKWPSAHEVYETIEDGECNDEFIVSLSRTAPRMRTEQLEYLVGHLPASCPANVRTWLGFVRGVKRRVDRIGDAYGGIEYALQDMVIASFLWEAVGPGTDADSVRDEQWLREDVWPPACALGAAEVATLLRAGLAFNHQTRQAQINNRVLLDLIDKRPGRFVREVLIEIGQNNPNAIPGVLFAFLEQDQDHMRAPLDLAKLLEKKLDLRIPRRAEFMAGGLRARDSYFEALVGVAEAIMDGADEVRAIKDHIQVVRRPVSKPHRVPRSKSDLAKRARAAIARADEVASKCTFSRDGVRGPVKRAISSYEDAFGACRDLIAADRYAFQLGWFKRFWARNESALSVLSVVRNYQQGIDRVVPWLHYYANRDGFDSEQDIVLATIDVLFVDKNNRAKLKKDPLVRLLIDPPEGRYDFSIVSAMGVVTEGADGHELEKSFERLLHKRGIRTLRAPTGTAMSIEENAQRIVSSIEQVTGPYGLLGYSQGCANMIAAESLLCGGTPREQEMIGRMSARNMLFSAFNGSPYGTFGSEKFLQQMIEAERFLKHYQVVFSSELVASFMNASKAMLDSRIFVQALGGIHSLTPTRAAMFHRDMQLVDHAPTSTIRAAASIEMIPEALEWMFHVLGVMAPGEREDTQVLTKDEVGHSTRIDNDATQLMARCEIPSFVQHSHHWSPLVRETEFVTTERDIDRHVYDSPKDRHVFPWIETCARLGIIGHR